MKFCASRFILALFMAGLPVFTASAAATNTTFTANLSQGNVAITLKAEPAQVKMDHDFMLTLHVAAPSYLTVALPDLHDRFHGFRSADGFVCDPIVDHDVTHYEQRWRLIPELMRAYRLAPFAVQVTDTRTHPATTSWLATRPVVFPPEPKPTAVGGLPDVSPHPFWIPPTLRMVLSWIAWTVLALALLAAIIYGLYRLSRHVREYRMTPRERAFAELERLLRRNLPTKHLYKDFYIELTMVVRRYIERAHALHAPEQTTEEFLTEAATHPGFPPHVLARLKTFLESADLVKFAGQEATPKTADESVQTARAYITTDADQVEQKKVKS